MFYLYILQSEKLNRFYVGSCQDIDDRIKKHLSDHKGFTGNAKDWKLVYQEIFDSKSSAYKRELEIKKWKSAKKIKTLIAHCK